MKLEIVRRPWWKRPGFVSWSLGLVISTILECGHQPPLASICNYGHGDYFVLGSVDGGFAGETSDTPIQGY